LRDYRKTYREHGKNLRKLENESFSSAAEETAAQVEAGASNHAAREAMIEAPIVSLDDIAKKLRFFFEVSGGMFDTEGWEARIVRNILRDIENSKGASSLQDLRKECVAAFRASQEADEAADEEGFRVRDLHPPCPQSALVELEGPNGERRLRPGTAEELANLEQQGRLADLLEWEAACDAIDAQHPKLRELKDAAKAANARWLQLDDQFIATPARSLEDIGVKLKFLTVMADMKDDPDAEVPDRMTFSLLRDIERMTGAKL
jgi:hypothetical protein